MAKKPAKKAKGKRETVIWWSRFIMVCVAFIVFIGLIAFSVIYNTLKEQPTQWYWGLIGALVVVIGVTIKWFFKK